MNFFKVVILSFLVLSNSLKVSFVYGWYVLDIDSFVEQLCENKDTPELQCNGKCYLSKVSKTTSPQEEQTIPLLEWDQLVFCQTKLTQDSKIAVEILEHLDFYYLTLSTEGYSQSIFHPPQI